MEKLRLRGTMKDVAYAERLYKEVRAIDALKVLDRIIGLAETDSKAQKIDRLRNLIAYDDTGDIANESIFDRSITADGILRVTINADEMVLFNSMLTKLMEMRCLSFSALVGPTMDVGGLEKAMENSEIVLAVFPDNPTLLALAAQILLAVGQIESGNMLLRMAYQLDPNEPYVRVTVQYFDPFGLIDKTIFANKKPGL